MLIAHIHLFIFPINAKPENETELWQTHSHTQYTSSHLFEIRWWCMHIGDNYVDDEFRKSKQKEKLQARSLVRAPGGKCNILKFRYYFRWVGCWICGTRTTWKPVCGCHFRRRLRRHRRMREYSIFAARQSRSYTICAFSFIFLIFTPHIVLLFRCFFVPYSVTAVESDAAKWRNVSSNRENKQCDTKLLPFGSISSSGNNSFLFVHTYYVSFGKYLW